ncbi:MAG: hypothetical protein KGY56_10685 [Desulfobacterales bacterium]|nr:hypothetical protein [Desulfobacterales bacterium]
MEDKGYSLVFEGTVMPGFGRAEVINRMARRLGKDPEHIKPLFRDKPVTVRKGIDREKALDQQRIFSKMGVRCAVWPQPEDPRSGDTEKPENAGSRQQCPKCGSDLTKFGTRVDECPFCSIIISKYSQVRRQ